MTTTKMIAPTMHDTRTTIATNNQIDLSIIPIDHKPKSSYSHTHSPSSFPSLGEGTPFSTIHTNK